jgi:cobalt/nickel transport system ATP-binding protein
MTDPHLITIEDLQFTYPNGVMALTEVSLKIDEGRKIVFLGPNGAGKSTLFLHLNGILRPKKGRVLIQGVPIKYDQRSLAILR